MGIPDWVSLSLSLSLLPPSLSLSLSRSRSRSRSPSLFFSLSLSLSFLEGIVGVGLKGKEETNHFGVIPKPIWAFRGTPKMALCMCVCVVLRVAPRTLVGWFERQPFSGAILN